MRLVHRPRPNAEPPSRSDPALTGESDDTDADGIVIASSVDTADTLFRKMRGLMFRGSIPDDYALVFRFDSVKPRDVHMLFVFTPLDVVWVRGDVVARIEQLSPWRGFARESADLIVELPPGAAEDVTVGDRLVLESGT